MTHALPTLRRVWVYGPNREHREDYAREMELTAEIAVEAVEYPRQAVQDVDVIVVVSNSKNAVLEADWVKPGARIVSISGGQLPQDPIVRSRVTVSARDEFVGTKTREPYSAMIGGGAWAADRVAEIGEIILGDIPGRVRDDEIVIHEMPGLSFWDAAILGWAYDWAVRNGVGTSFNLSAVEVKQSKNPLLYRASHCSATSVVAKASTVRSSWIAHQQTGQLVDGRQLFDVGQHFYGAVGVGRAQDARGAGAKLLPQLFAAQGRLLAAARGGDVARDLAAVG
jgi:hypothetical protein